MGPKTVALKQLCASLGRKYVGFRAILTRQFGLSEKHQEPTKIKLEFPLLAALEESLTECSSKLESRRAFCCFVNPYKVRPPNNDIDRIEETGITRLQFEEQFFEELREYKPRFIVSCGGTALKILCGFTIDPRDKESKISKWRGSLLSVEELQWNTTFFLTFTLHTSFESGRIATFQYSFFDDSKRSMTISKLTRISNRSPNES